jgi:hypothetical protein
MILPLRWVVVVVTVHLPGRVLLLLVLVKGVA